ncbi:serine/threonine-protein kinase [Streptomyces sp. JB150]|uniref:serine/threonine-protein kinase n=1 Tax=Streptomyces sp. JB150 TaxID=2714844 RepID=UPI00140BCE71|nr:serine/threonine-protein kinase [Streptomyces sp. JB150]QIJ60931.1 serine/threonine protein kinase [Streptomyces sp. JB150]
MTMGEAYVGTRRSVAGRYRLLGVVHRETNRVCWYGEDAGTGRPCLVTGIGLPQAPGDDGARRIAGRVIRGSGTVEGLCPGRVVPVLDAVVEDGVLWTVSDWVGGTPLGDLLSERGPFHHVRAARIGLELLDVLDAAHAEGVTHGELSPGQVVVPERGPVVVTGFGLAGATLAPRLTAPSYASPEQARDERVGPAADLWALGAVLYTLVEGRPPFRERDRPEATLRGVDRLPLRTPVRAGPLARVVQGLLRKDARERLTRPVVRAALLRVVHEDPGAPLPSPPQPRVRRAYAAVRHAAPGWSWRTVAAGTAVTVVTVAVAVLVATMSLREGGPVASDAPPSRPSASAASGTSGGRPGDSGGSATGEEEAGPREPGPARPDPPRSAAPSPTPPPARTPAPSPPGLPGVTGLPEGFRTHAAPEGFSVALPEGWRPLRTSRVPDVGYRVVLGADGDDRTLAVTYSERVGPDPVAVWRDDVEPGLKGAVDGYRRLGAIRATRYQGREAADMEWVAGAGGFRVRTFGRGFLIGGGRGFSLRWTAPADGFGAAENRQALDTALRTFRIPPEATHG